MARDWSVPNTLAGIIARMGDYGANTAEFPVCMTMENRDGELVWCVELHVRIPRVTEFPISTEGPTLSEALRSAYLALNDRKGVLRRAAHSNAQFAVLV